MCLCARASAASVAHLAPSLFLVIFTQKEGKKTSMHSLTTSSVRSPTRPPTATWQGARTDCQQGRQPPRGEYRRLPAALWQGACAAMRGAPFLEEEISFSCSLIMMMEVEEEKEISSSPKAIVFSHDLCSTKK